jgi:hypothetical protein
MKDSTILKFAQIKFILVQTYSPKFIAWDWPKLRGKQIKDMNENGKKRRTKITASNRNPRGQEENLGLNSHSKSQEIHHEFSVHVTSLMRH